nr:S26 family signal peptidase [uncultured Hyphomonas sp.]
MKASMSLTWLVAGLVLLGSSSPAHPVRIIWNRTDSVARGLYTVQTLSPDAIPEIGDMVTFSPAPQDRVWLEGRGYIGENWPLLKYVAALPGDTVCRHGATIRINHLPAARALAKDGEGRPLPVWQGCYKLAEGDVFLLAPHTRSLDGRYMGIQRSGRILGKARRVLAWGKSGSSSSCIRPSTTDRFAGSI